MSYDVVMHKWRVRSFADKVYVIVNRIDNECDVNVNVKLSLHESQIKCHRTRDWWNSFTGLAVGR